MGLEDLKAQLYSHADDLRKQMADAPFLELQRVLDSSSVSEQVRNEMLKMDRIREEARSVVGAGFLPETRLYSEAALAGVLKPTAEMETLFSRRALALNKLSADLDSSRLLGELSLASRAVADLQMTPGFQASQANAARIFEVTGSIGMELARTLSPLRTIVAEAETHFASQLESHRSVIDGLKLAFDQRWLRDSETVSGRIAGIARINFGISESALFHWPEKIVANRASLLEDCFLNTAALGRFVAAVTVPDATLSLERLAAASQFVFDHAEVVRFLPPRLPGPERVEQTPDDEAYRDEEISAKLELALRDFDPRLLDLRRKAWRNLSGGIPGARLAMAGIREVFTDILHGLAPDAEVKATTTWQTRPKNIMQPTRRMRLEYILGEKRASEADAMLQFSESINRTQTYVHTFADDAELVRVHMAQMETWIYLLLLDTKRRSN